MRALSACRVAVALAMLSSPLYAQGSPNSAQRSMLSHFSNRVTLDAAFDRTWLHNSSSMGDHPVNAGTGRLSWRLGQPAVTESDPVPAKVALGVFWTRAPQQRLPSGRVGFEHFGGFAEVSPVGIVGMGYLEPNFGLAVGSFRPEIADRHPSFRTAILNYGDAPRANLGIVPSAGTRVWLFRRTGLRFDLHDLIVHSDKAWINDFGFSAGIMARF